MQIRDNPLGAANNSPRCGAKTRRGTPCRCPIVSGCKRCRIHGARAGAPTGTRHGGYRHGLRTKEAMADRKALAALLRRSRELIEAAE